MKKLCKLFLSASLGIANAVSYADSLTESPDVAPQKASNSVNQSVIYAPESLRQSYPFLRDTGKDSPFHKFAPGTTIFLNPGDVKPQSKEPLRDIINAALPEGSPYKELLYYTIRNDREDYVAITNPNVDSPGAVILPGLKDQRGRQLQVVVIRPIEDYGKKSGFSVGYMGFFTGIGNKYQVQRLSSDMSLMAAAVLHELGHARDEKFAIARLYNSREFILPLQLELVADCAAHEGAKTKGVGDVLGITPQTMLEYRYARAISMLLKPENSHATAIFDLGADGCSKDFSEANFRQERNDLVKLKREIILRVGQHFLPSMLDALVNGKDKISAGITLEERMVLEHYANDRSQIPDLHKALSFYNEDDFKTYQLGQNFAQIDPAIVYGVIKNMLENPQENKKLSELQKRYARNFIEASDQLYPDMKLSPFVQLGHQISPYSSVMRQTTIQGYIDNLPPRGGATEQRGAPAP